MITKILEFLMECPELRDAAFNLNYLEGKPLACSVGQVGDDPVIKRYADGGSLCACRATVAIRHSYSQARSTNLDAAELCRRVEQWIKDRDRQGLLPLSDGARPLSMEVTRSFSLDSTASVDAVYRGELKLIYVKD